MTDTTISATEPGELVELHDEADAAAEKMEPPPTLYAATWNEAIEAAARYIERSVGINATIHAAKLRALKR